MKKQRKTRAKVYKINQLELRKDLEPFAQLRKTKWAWDGSHYAKLARSLGADPLTLALGAVILMVLLQHAPNGFPQHCGLRSVLTDLHMEYDLFYVGPKSDLFEVANNVSNAWRTMLRHCVELKKAGRTVASRELTEVLDKVVVDYTLEAPAVNLACGSKLFCLILFTVRI